VSSPMAAPRLLVVTERYWPDGNGGEFATHLILELLRDSFEVTVVTGTRSPARMEGVTHIYEPLLSARNKHLLWFNTLRLARSRAFEKFVERADVVYVPRFAFPVIPLAKRLGKRVVVHLHGYIPVSYTAVVLAPFEEHRHRVLRDDLKLECMKSFKHCTAAALTVWWMPRLARRWISTADAVICVSKRQAQIISEIAPELRDKITIIYNPPPEVPKIEKKPSGKPMFLYSGGGSIVKGFPIILGMLKELGKSNRRLEARFIFASTYTEQQIMKLQNLKKRYGLNIEVLGRISHESVLKLHSESWALLFPSISEEPLPYSVVGSMLLGTIPIAFRSGEAPEIPHGTLIEKFIYEPNNVRCFNERIKEVSSLNYEEVIDLNTKLGSVKEGFDRDKLREEFMDVFQK